MATGPSSPGQTMNVFGKEGSFEITASSYNDQHRYPVFHPEGKGFFTLEDVRELLLNWEAAQDKDQGWTEDHYIKIFGPEERLLFALENPRKVGGLYGRWVQKWFPLEDFEAIIAVEW